MRRDAESVGGGKVQKFDPAGKYLKLAGGGVGKKRAKIRSCGGKNISFLISINLMKKVDKAIEDWGFATRAEFFRFCAIGFLKEDAAVVSADEALHGYSKAIRGIRAAKDLAKRGLR